MAAGIERDLAAFERGELSREHMERTYGGAIGPVLSIYERMQADHARSEGAVAGGSELAHQALPPDAELEPTARVESLSKVSRARSRRSTALLLAATLMLGGSAFASTGGFGLLDDGSSDALDGAIGSSGGGSPTGLGNAPEATPDAASDDRTRRNRQHSRRDGQQARVELVVVTPRSRDVTGGGSGGDAGSGGDQGGDPGPGSDPGGGDGGGGSGGGGGGGGGGHDDDDDDEGDDHDGGDDDHDGGDDDHDGGDDDHDGGGDDDDGDGGGGGNDGD